MTKPKTEEIRDVIISLVDIEQTKILYGIKGSLYFLLTKKEKLPPSYLESQDKVIRGVDYVICKCSYCGNYFDQKVNHLKKTAKSKYLNNKITCGGDKSECNKLKQRELNSLREKLGTSPAQGRIRSEEEKAKKTKTMEEKYNGKFPWSEKRKGVSLIEYYGEEKAQKLIITMKKSYKELFADKGISPHLGHTHSGESKEIISEKLQKFLYREANEKNKNYISPLTNEKVDIFTYRSHVIKNWQALLTEEEWAKINSENSKRMADIVLNRRMKNSSYDTGLVKNWYTGKEEFYESSYEKRLMYILNYFKIYWQRNISIKIPYQGINAKKGLRYYVPDILLFTDDSYSEIRRIIEVKPEKMQKLEINILKFSSLQEFCRINHIKCCSLNFKVIKRLERIRQYEDQKDNKKEA